jgi:hypothetical protein
MGEYFGVNDFTELPGEFQFDPRTGVKITQRFRGTPGPMAALVQGFRNSKSRYMQTQAPNGGHWYAEAYLGAEATQPANQPLADLWDLDGNDIERTLWSHPKTQSMMASFYKNGAPSPTGIKFANNLQAVIDGTLSIDNFPFYPTDPTYVLPFLDAMLNGQDAYYSSEWVLRRRLVIGLNSTIRPSQANINKVFPTTESLQTLEEVPNLPFDLPEGMWLKKSPHFQQIDADKWQILQEWWWGLEYSEYSYDQAS